MSEPFSPDHDQRLKVLVKEFFEQFFLCFFPQWAERFDFTEITCSTRKSLQRRHKERNASSILWHACGSGLTCTPPQPGLIELIALVHIEVESRDSVQQFRPRMFGYYTQLRRDSNLPVLPIGLYLRVGLDGVGWDAYEEHFWEHRLLRFEYAYVGLPALRAEEFATGEQILGVALSSLMRTTQDRRVELYAESLKRIALSKENDFRRHLLSECLEAYANLNEEQLKKFQSLLDTEPYREAKPLMITTFERGKAEGKIEGR